MRSRILIIAILIMAVLLAGCTDDQTAEENNSSGNMTDIPGENVSSEDNVSEETPVDVPGTNVSEEGNDTTETPVDSDYEPRSYTIRLEKYNANLKNLEINRTDNVIWMNLQKDPSMYLTIVSTEDLWEPETIGRGRTFIYQFNESGVFTAYVLPEWYTMNMTITVK
jgi:hypothetical protein